MKVLILKPSSLGDVVHALPVVRLLKLAKPEAEIHWWINRELMPLLEWDPDIDRLIPFDRHLWAKPRGWPVMAGTIRGLREERYDWILDLQSLIRSSAIGWLSHGQVLAGLEDWREAAPLLHDVAVPRPTPDTHAVDWYLSLISKLGISTDRPFSWFPTNGRGSDLLKASWPEALEGTWIGLQPGARWDTKRWPPEYYAGLAAKLLQERPDARIVIFGGKADREIGEQITSQCAGRALNLAGKISLNLLVEWMRHIQLLVTNDTGPMHIAAAMNRPIVAIFGPTNPGRTGPYRQPDAVMQASLACVPCMKQRCALREKLACLHAITVNAVFDQCLVRLNGNPTPIGSLAPN